jgi:hypothetical protein
MKTLALAFALSSLSITSGFCQTPTPDISGNYACVKVCGCQTKDRNPSIVQTATGLMFSNECSSNPSRAGKVTSPTTFIVYDWGLTGNIMDDGKRLLFSNGTEWVRQ